MTEAKVYTPGPWEISGTSGSIRTSSRPARHIANPAPDTLRAVRAEKKANARLMAAAPELLEALLDVWDSTPRTMPGKIEEFVDGEHFTYAVLTCGWCGRELEAVQVCTADDCLGLKVKKAIDKALYKGL